MAVVVGVTAPPPPPEDVFMQPLLGVRLERREQRTKSRELERPRPLPLWFEPIVASGR